eukprot:6024538-Pleurochrysis_carterae.AAC.1
MLSFHSALYGVGLHLVVGLIAAEASLASQWLPGEPCSKDVMVSVLSSHCRKQPIVEYTYTVVAVVKEEGRASLARWCRTSLAHRS